MFDRLIHFWCLYVGDIGAWHARSNYPRDEHGVPWPVYTEGPQTTPVSNGNVISLEDTMEARRG